MDMRWYLVVLICASLMPSGFFPHLTCGICARLEYRHISHSFQLHCAPIWLCHALFRKIWLLFNECSCQLMAIFFTYTVTWWSFSDAFKVIRMVRSTSHKVWCHTLEFCSVKKTSAFSLRWWLASTDVKRFHFYFFFCLFNSCSFSPSTAIVQFGAGFKNVISHII